MSENNVFNASTGNSEELKTWLNTTRPSSNNLTNDGWYWIKAKSQTEGEDGLFDEKKHSKFLEEGEILVNTLVKECARIKEEAPIRANKKLGIESQKDLRERAYAKFNFDVKELSIKTNHLSGKWLLYPTPENVDTTWAKVSKGYLEGGPLVEAGSSTAKVACALKDEAKVYVICIYCDDSFDKAKVKKLLDALIKDCNVVPSSYKCDANTYLDIDSNHVSGIKSSTYTPSVFYTKDEIASMLEAKSFAKVAKPANDHDDLEIGVASDSEDDEPRVKRQKR